MKPVIVAAALLAPVVFARLGPARAADDTAWVRALGGRTTLDRGRRVTAVDLRASWVTDGDLARLSAFAGLHTLDLAHTRVSDQGLRHLRPLLNIRVLNLRFSEQVSDEGIQPIKSWQALERIDLHGTQITDTTLALLARLPRIKDIRVGHARVTDAGLSFLGRVPALESLAVGGNRITELGLQSLRMQQSLRHLDLGGRQRTDSGLWTVSLSPEGLAAVAALPALETLVLAELPVTPDLLEALAQAASEHGPIKALDLRGCDRLTDEAVPVLSRFAGLRRLDLRGTAIGGEALSQLRVALQKTELIIAPSAAPVAAQRLTPRP